MATIGVKIQLEGTKEYQQGMKNLKEQTKLFDTQLKNLDQTMKGSSAFAKARKEHELLTQKMEALNKESDLLKDRIQKATEAYGENDTRVLALQTQYEKLQAEISKTSDALAANGGAFGAVTAELDSIATKCDVAGEKITAVGENLTTHLTAPLVALGAASVAAFKDVDDGMDTIIKKTGASGEALEEMQKSAENLATSIPTSFDEAGAAIGEVNTRFGLTGDELESLSKQFIEFAQLNDTDVSTSIDNVQAAMAAFGLEAEDASAFLDTLNAAGQATGVSVDQLASDMTSNAAALKEMGFSASDSAMFLANLNKQGIDSSSVMSGLKKALANSISEGKSMDEAISDLEETMMNADSSTEAYQAALELFGNKAGPAIAEAVKSGRLSFKKLDTTMTDFAGNVSDTFDATLDPIDKFQTNLNKVKIAGSKLVDAAGPMISNFFDKLSNAIDKITAKWNSLSEGEQEQIIKIGLIVAAVGPLLVGIGKVVSAIGSLTSGVSGLIGFIVANPVLAGITAALGLATVAIIDAKTHADELYHSFADLDEQQKALADSAKEYNDHIDTFIQNNSQTLAGIDAQYNAEKKLKEELQNIVDENGNVKEGYEERARVISTELAEAFGIDIEYQNGTIQNYDEILSKIDEVIEKKKAEALLSSSQAEYTQALTDQVQKYEDLKKAQDDLASTKTELASAQEELTKAQEDYDFALSTGGAAAAYTYASKLADAGIKVQGLSNKQTELQGSLAAAQEAFYNNQAVIANYENLQEIVTTGTGDLNQAITNMNYNLMNDAPITFLQQQADDAKTYYEQILSDYESGEVRISEAQLAAAESYATEAEKILQNAQSTYSNEGQMAGEGYATGLESKTERVKSAAGSVVAAALSAIAAAQETGSPAKKYKEQGEYAGEGYVTGLEAKQKSIESTLAAINLMLSNMQMLNSTNLQTGLTNDQLIIDGAMSKIIMKLEGDFLRINTDVTQTLDNSQTMVNSKFSAIESNISAKMYSISSNISSRCSDIQDIFTNLSNNSYSWGYDFMDNFESGINAKMSSILQSVQNMAAKIASYMHFSVPDKGPLADADKWMPDFMKLLAEGIDSNSYLIDNAVKGVATDMSNILSNPIDYDAMYDAIRSGAADATTRIILNGRDLTRGLKDLGVVFNG